MSFVLDQLDLKILGLIQSTGRMAAAKIGEQVGLSESACHIRLKRLYKSGVVVGDTTQVDLSKIGSHTVIYTWVSLSDDQRDTQAKFEQHVNQVAEVVECDYVSGEFDYLLKTVVRNFEDYLAIFEELQQQANIVKYQTFLRVRNTKNNVPPLLKLFGA